MLKSSFFLQDFITKEITLQLISPILCQKTKNNKEYSPKNRENMMMETILIKNEFANSIYPLLVTVCCKL